MYVRERAGYDIETDPYRGMFGQVLAHDLPVVNSGDEYDYEFGVVGDAAAQQAEVDRATAILGNVQAAAVENLAPYSEALDKLATGVVLQSRGDSAGAALQFADAVFAAAAAAGPVGIAIGSVLKVFKDFMVWLADTYPARQVCCAQYLDTELPRNWRVSDLGKFYRDDGWLYVASFLMKTAKLGSFPSVGTTSGLASDCYPTLPGGYFNARTDTEREAALRRLCTPERAYLSAKPSVGFKSWSEYEAKLRRDGNYGQIQIELDAAQKIGDSIFEKIKNEGELRKFSFQMGDLCWAQGFGFKVQSIPNHTLLNLIRKLAMISPAAKGLIGDANELVAMEEVTYPGLEGSTTIVWRDRLSDAIAFTFASSDQNTYHMAALLAEYKRRLDAGLIAKPGSTKTSVASLIARLPMLRSSNVKKLGLKSVKMFGDSRWKTGQKSGLSLGAKIGIGVCAAAAAGGFGYWLWRRGQRA